MMKAANVPDVRLHVYDEPGRPLTMTEGVTKYFVKIRQEFLLTQNQLDTESELHSGRTLGLLIAPTLAQVTDGIIFHGHNYNSRIPAEIFVERPPHDEGLVGLALSRVDQPLEEGRPELIYDAVVEARARLNARGMSIAQNQLALFLESSVFAQAQSALASTLVTPYQSIMPLVGAGFFSASGLLPNTGLLVAIGSDPICLAIRDEATATWLRQDGDGHHFHVYSSFQYVVKDRRALVAIKFHGSIADE
jgi:hypothetical protein